MAAGHTGNSLCPVIGNREPDRVGVGDWLAAGVRVGEGVGGTAIGVAAAAPGVSVGDGLAAAACPLPTTSVTVA